MVITEKTTGKRVGFGGENDEKIASEPEEDVNQSAENSKGSFIDSAFLNCDFMMVIIWRVFYS